MIATAAKTSVLVVKVTNYSLFAIDGNNALVRKVQIVSVRLKRQKCATLVLHVFLLCSIKQFKFGTRCHIGAVQYCTEK